jgi:hypothetical protein
MEAKERFECLVRISSKVSRVRKATMVRGRDSLQALTRAIEYARRWFRKFGEQILLDGQPGTALSATEHPPIRGDLEFDFERAVASFALSFSSLLLRAGMHPGSVQMQHYVETVAKHDRLLDASNR